MKKLIKVQATTRKGPYGNTISVNTAKMNQLGTALRKVYDILYEMDDDTFQLVDGENMLSDVEDYIREVSDAIDFAFEG